MTEAIIIHTDGSCEGNPGPGGFAAIIEHPKHGELVITGGDPKTTNNRMELSAVIEALKAVNSDPKAKNRPIIVRSDSKYLTDAFNQNWIGGWRRNGWRTGKKEPVKNASLWNKLLEQTNGHEIKWVWVKGHNGDPMNERCDQLARQQAKTAPEENGYWANAGGPPKRTPEPAGPEAPEVVGDSYDPVLANILQFALKSVKEGSCETAAELIEQSLNRLERKAQR